VFNIFKRRLTKNKKALQSSNVIKLRKEPSSEMDLALFYKKVEEFLKKWLTKRQKCAGDFISKLIKSPLVNSGKFAIDKEKSNDLHP
jgi:16S rRNA A1518/A1519 N6-dimethyltransferase RsmA/KsgA/DIM1 with predicted DNA glycosylase/AP lyase activity